MKELKSKMSAFLSNYNVQWQQKLKLLVKLVLK
ncbi:unnamed protein product [Schistosoma mattheei]|uniref:Uncharacterized protein n=1 Tax=Schistosoma mattheei TaxID=31246 RepID=A0A3P8B8Z6_9TREM|nr:unnamed protein product [Schistosoma mattheei]